MVGKLPPSERWKNYASAFMTLWPAWLIVFGALGYTNKDDIKGFIFTSNNEAITTLTPFQQHMREEIERMDLERATVKAEMMGSIEALAKKLASQDTTNFRAQDKKINKLKERTDKLESLVN